MIEGWYYLHVNGSLIYKREWDGGTAADIRESDFAVMLWPFDHTDWAGAWRIVVEGLALGANPERVRELAEKWGCNDADAQEYAAYLGLVLKLDGDQWCAHRSDFVDLQNSPAGFGKTCLEAMAELAKELKLPPSKIGWASTFQDLVKVKPQAPAAGEAVSPS